LKSQSRGSGFCFFSGVSGKMTTFVTNVSLADSSRRIILLSSPAAPARFFMRSSLYLLTLLLLLFSLSVFAQTSTPHPAPGTRQDGNPPMLDEDEARDRLSHDMEKKAAKERVAALKSDTDKLLKLSVELKSYVDKSDENVLSLDVIKKADEIEKLAKSVKDKMKGPN
jgi:hypothetical protein